MGFTLYVHKRFDRVFKKTRLTDSVLCYAAGDVFTGVFEADLGGGVIKKRLALHQGKRGGARTVIFFRQGTTWFITMDGLKTCRGNTLKKSMKISWIPTGMWQECFSVQIVK